MAPGSPALARRRDAVRTTAVIGPTGVVHRGDLIEPGTLTAAVRARAPRVAVGHDWRRPVGDVVGAVELPAGDPRLPRTTSDGQPWPAGAGGCLLTIDLMSSTATRDAGLAVKSARAAGPGAAWSFGFKVVDGRSSNGVRRITSLSCYTVCPPETGTEAKAAAPYGLEVKGMNSRTIYPVFCGTCQVAKMRTDRPVIDNQPYECEHCARDRVLDDPWTDETGEGRGVLTAADLRDLDELNRITSEDAYAQAQRDEREFDVDADGTLGQTSPERRRWRP